LVEFRQIARVEGRDDHALECAVGGADGARQLQQPYFAGASEQRLADEELVRRRALVDIEIVAFAGIGAPAICLVVEATTSPSDR